MTTAPDGLYQYGGEPVGGARFTSPWATHYFVDGANGAAGNTGLTPSDALSTIQGAVSKASRGDIIYIRPQTYKIGTGFNRYTEDVAVTLGGAGGSAVVATNSDISIIGVTNTLNPEFGVRWMHATSYPLLSDAPGLHVENIGFFAEGATYAIYLRNDGASYVKRGSDGTTFYNCHIKGAALYVASGGTGLAIRKCQFQTAYDGSTGGYGNIYYTCSANPGRRFTVAECVFQPGLYHTPVSTYITILPPCTQIDIDRCSFEIIPDSTYFINADSGTSGDGTNLGIMRGCWFGKADITPGTDWKLGGIIDAGNFDSTNAMIA